MRVLATQLRNVIYAITRESVQASLSMTGKHGPTKIHGIHRDDVSVLGWAYGTMRLSMGFVQDSISPKVLPPGQCDQHGDRRIILRGKLPPALAGFLGNASSAAVMGLAYRTTNQTFQAHMSVRKAVAAGET